MQRRLKIGYNRAARLVEAAGSGRTPEPNGRRIARAAATGQLIHAFSGPRPVIVHLHSASSALHPCWENAHAAPRRCNAVVTDLPRIAPARATSCRMPRPVHLKGQGPAGCSGPGALLGLLARRQWLTAASPPALPPLHPVDAPWAS